MQNWQLPYAQSQAPSNENVKPPVLLSNPEARVILGQLYELQALRVQIVDIRFNDAKELARYEAEKQLWLDKIAQEKASYELAVQKTALVEREVALLKDEVGFYKSALTVCNSNKHRGFGCTLKRIFTLGLARCR